MIDKFSILVPESMKYLADQKVGGGICFDIPGSGNVAFLRLQKGYQHPGQVYLKIDVAPEGSDKATGYFFYRAESPEQMREYLLDPGHAEDVKKAIRELNEAVNRRDD